MSSANSDVEFDQMMEELCEPLANLHLDSPSKSQDVCGYFSIEDVTKDQWTPQSPSVEFPTPEQKRGQDVCGCYESDIQQQIWDIYKEAAKVVRNDENQHRFLFNDVQDMEWAFFIKKPFSLKINEEEMKTYYGRLKSFFDWEHPGNVKKFASAGFFNIGHNKIIICSKCFLCVRRDWKALDCPYKIHRLHNANCDRPSVRFVIKKRKRLSL